MAPMAGWGFLTNHALVLLCIARDHRTRVRDIAQCTGITERAAQSIVGDLVEAGYLTRHRVGLRNVYEVHPALPLRHPLLRNADIGELLAPLARGEEDTGRRSEFAAAPSS